MHFSLLIFSNILNFTICPSLYWFSCFSSYLLLKVLLYLASPENGKLIALIKTPKFSTESINPLNSWFLNFFK